MRIYLFMIIFMSVFILLSLFIQKRLIDQLDISKRTKRFFSFFLLINLFGVAGYFYLRYEPSSQSWLYFLFTIPIGIIFLLFCTTLIYELGRFTLNKIPLSTSRRDFFKKSLDISSVLLASGLIGRSFYEAKHVITQKVDVKINNLQKNYSIVQLSDVHIGGLIDKDFIHQLVQNVNKLQPDIVVITGDLVDIHIDQAKPALNELKNLRTNYGTYFVVGNHEYFHNVDNIIKEVNALGIKTLENENVYIGEENQGFNLAGVYDVFGYRADYKKPDIKKALQNIQNAPTVLLAHQPRFIEEVENVDLMLSGHTHGGQLYPFRFLVKLVQPYISGLHTHDERLQIYVNKGTGFWGPPMRLGASSEITHLTLHS